MRRLLLVFGLAVAAYFAVRSALPTVYQPIPLGAGFDPPKPQFLSSGWTLDVVSELPQSIRALHVTRDRAGEICFAGAGPIGAIYQFTPRPPYVYQTVALGMGDDVHAGHCDITSLTTRDLDRNGRMELIAATSQARPMGRPRVYVMTAEYPYTLRGVATPRIESSWSHGLGFGFDHANGRDTILSAYCGHGEIVEYRLFNIRSESGFAYEGLAWKKIGQMPGSGEYLQTADVDNDRWIDLVVASGFRIGESEIHVYSKRPGLGGIASQVEGTSTIGDGYRLAQVIDEQRRFGNVRFIVGEAGTDGRRELIAWWCAGLADGHCEVIRYRLSPKGIVARHVLASGDASALWPIDGQMLLADTDGDGVNEVWSASGSGNLWRFDVTDSKRRSPADALEANLVCTIADGIGPIAAGFGNDKQQKRHMVYLASRHRVLLLGSTQPAPLRPRKRTG